MDMKKKTSYVILLENEQFLESITGINDAIIAKTTLRMPNVLTFYGLEEAKDFLNALIHLGLTSELILETGKEIDIEKSKIVQINVIDEKEYTNGQYEKVE